MKCAHCGKEHDYDDSVACPECEGPLCRADCSDKGTCMDYLKQHGRASDLEYAEGEATTAESCRLSTIPIAHLIAELDATVDKGQRIKIAYMLLERLGVYAVGFEALAKARADLADRVRRSRHGHLVDWLFGTDALELLDGYVNIAPLHCWRHMRARMLGDRPFGRFGNERCGSQKGGARWGVYLYGIEFGSRNPDDVVGGWLKRHGLWPW